MIAVIDETKCDCPWDDVGGDMLIGGFRDPNPDCRKCGGTGVETDPIQAVALLTCPEKPTHGTPLGVIMAHGQVPTFRHWSKCLGRCEGTGMRYPSLSQECQCWCHSEVSRASGQYCENGCGYCGTMYVATGVPPLRGRINVVTMDKVLAEVTKLELADQYKFARILLEGDPIGKDKMIQPKRAIVYLISLTAKERLTVACVALRGV